MLVPLLQQNQHLAIRGRHEGRKVLVTKNGARFLVPEDQLDQWTEPIKTIKSRTVTVPKRAVFQEDEDELLMMML